MVVGSIVVRGAVDAAGSSHAVLSADFAVGHS